MQLFQSQLIQALIVSAVLGQQATNANTTQDDSVSARVVGGKQTTPFQYPYMVTLTDSQISCGGSIIATNLVVTAAHCITQRDPSRFKVVGHRHDMRQSEQAERAVNFRVKQVVVHPQYQPENMHENDIALLVLDNNNPNAISGANMDSMIELDTQGPSRGQDVTVIGWGYDNDLGIPRPSPVLKEVTLSVTDGENCRRMFAQEDPNLGRFPVNPATKICAAQKRQRESSCKGDSGGPLVVGNKLVGLVSHGLPKCNGAFTVYTRVANYINWINQYKSKGNDGNQPQPEQPEQPEQPQWPPQQNWWEQQQQPQQNWWEQQQQPQQNWWEQQQPQQNWWNGWF